MTNTENTENTPPADDVREALAAIESEHEEVYDHDLGRNVCACGDDYTEGLMSEHRARAILAVFEVRPRGTVTGAAHNGEALTFEQYVDGKP